MPIIRYHHEDGHIDEREVPPGTSVMRAAINTGVEGIVAECGGQLMCATCHAYVDEKCLGSLPEISDEEEEMLEATSEERDVKHSRLSCQLVMGDGLDEIDLDEIDIYLPATQV